MISSRCVSLLQCCKRVVFIGCLGCKQSAARGVRVSKLFADPTLQKQSAENADAPVEPQQGNPLTVELIRSGLGSLGYHPQTLRYTYTSLTLRDKAVTSLTEIARWKQLLVVDLAENLVTDLTPLGSLPYLVAVNFSFNRVEDCLQYRTPLFSEETPNPVGETMLGSMLARANLSHNCITAVESIDHHPFLEELILAHNQVERLHQMRALRHLRILDLSHNKLENLTALSGLALKELYLDHNHIQDLGPLSLIPELSILTVAHNQVSNLQPLQNLSHLQAVNLQHNNLEQINQVAYLADARWLHTVILADNPCTTKEYYRYLVVGRLLQLKTLDNIAVTAKDKVKAQNLLGGEACDAEVRAANYRNILGEDPPPQSATPFVDDELS